ncbi:MAG: restriction endonuclease subunit S [Candidatus Gastranaerophilales bacterium]|nr:restriction endonuclease subunit S [Candidatus Gastranaerophilales bacterium]
MSIGITDEEQKIIIDILDKYKEYLFYFYGSRVKGTYEKTSDLDILIRGKQEMPLNTLEDIKQAFDESKLPYIVNFSDYHSINKTFYKKIEKDLFPYNWKECKLGDLCKIKGGKRLPSGKNLTTKPNTHPYIRVRDLTNIKTLNLTPDFEYVDDEVQKTIDRYIVNTGDVIISIVGTIGLISIIGPTLDNANLTENCAKLIDLKGIDNHFLYYYLISNEGQQEINRNSVGAVQAKLPLYGIGDIRIILPPLEIQRKIAKVLSAIDDKIELNNSINNNLEQQAQAIFKSWFIDFEPFGGTMPKDWCNGNLADIAKDIICGKTPSTAKKEYYGNDIPFITIPDMHNNTYIIKTERYLSALGAESQINKLLPANSICVSCIATAGLVSLTSMNSQTNQQINSIIPKKEVSPYYVYMLLKSLSEKIIMLGSSGSTTCNLNKGQFAKIEIIIPSQQILDKFNELVKFLFEQIKNLQIENQQLVQLRDTLLPKLMSGEIDVDKVEV